LNSDCRFSLAQSPESLQKEGFTMTMAATPFVQTFIMAGGRGERLYPLTASRPKPAVPFGGVFRIVDFTLSNCLNSGLANVALLTQYRHEELQSYIQRTWSGLWSGADRGPLECVPPRRGARYRGTADAVFQNLAALRQGTNEPVLILSADQVYQMDYRELLAFHASTDADLTICTVEHSLDTAKNFGVVEVDNAYRVVGFQEKPSIPRPFARSPAGALVNMGVYVFRKEMLMQALCEFCRSDNDVDFGYHIIPSLVRSSHVRAFEFRDKTRDLPGYWRDIGTVDVYHETSMDLARPRARLELFSNSTWPAYPSARFRSPSDVRARLRTKCSVRRSILSPGVHIESGSTVESSVLMERVCVNRNAQIRNAIIEEGVCVPYGSQIGFDLDSDRKHHFVTEAGVVVVSQTPPTPRTFLAGSSRLVNTRTGSLHSA
jgi:glucose-1-phosphate adenylyltransferase